MITHKINSPYLFFQFAEFDLTELVVNLAELIASQIEYYEKIFKFLNNRSQNK